MEILNDTVLFLHCQFYDSYLNIYRPNQSREACKPCLARPPLHTRVLSWRFAVLRTLVSCVVVVQGPVLLVPVFPALPSSGDASWTVRVCSKHGKQRKLRGSSRVSLVKTSVFSRRLILCKGHLRLETIGSPALGQGSNCKLLRSVSIRC